MATECNLALRDELIKVFTPDFHSSREFINFICNDHSLAAPRPPRRPGRHRSSGEVRGEVNRKCFHGRRFPISLIALRLMTWTNNFSKTFLIFASLIPFFRLIIPEKCFYQ